MNRRIRAFAAAAAAAVALTGAALAKPAAPTQKHGLAALLHRHPTTVRSARHGAMHRPKRSYLAAPRGMWVGNLKSRVVHKPGATGLPDPKNRVYFRSLADAIHHGYHLAKNEGGGMTSGNRGHALGHRGVGRPGGLLHHATSGFGGKTHRMPVMPGRRVHPMPASH